VVIVIDDPRPIPGLIDSPPLCPPLAHPAPVSVERSPRVNKIVHARPVEAWASCESVGAEVVIVLGGIFGKERLGPGTVHHNDAGSGGSRVVGIYLRVAPGKHPAARRAAEVVSDVARWIDAIC